MKDYKYTTVKLTKIAKPLNLLDLIYYVRLKISFLIMPRPYYYLLDDIKLTLTAPKPKLPETQIDDDAIIH